MRCVSRISHVKVMLGVQLRQVGAEVVERLGHLRAVREQGAREEPDLPVRALRRGLEVLRALGSN